MTRDQIITIVTSIATFSGIIWANVSNRNINKAKANSINIGGEKTALELYQSLLKTVNELTEKYDTLLKEKETIAQEKENEKNIYLIRINDLEGQVTILKKTVDDNQFTITELTEKITKYENTDTAIA